MPGARVSELCLCDKNPAPIVCTLITTRKGYAFTTLYYGIGLYMYM